MKQIPCTYTFRLITSEVELAQAFRHLFEVYRHTPILRDLLTEKPAHMDIDGYDKRKTDFQKLLDEILDPANEHKRRADAEMLKRGMEEKNSNYLGTYSSITCQ